MSDWESKDRIRLLDESASVTVAGDGTEATPQPVESKKAEGNLSLEALEPKAVATMSDLMDDMDGKVRLAAAQDVLDRVGKPRRKNDAGGGGRTVILNFPPAAITDALKGMKEFIDVGGERASIGKETKNLPATIPTQPA